MRRWAHFVRYTVQCTDLKYVKGPTLKFVTLPTTADRLWYEINWNARCILTTTTSSGISVMYTESFHHNIRTLTKLFVD